MVRRRRTQQPEEEFQMAPMIDMVFLLLVFFMTVSTLVREDRIEIPLPESDVAAVPSDLGSRGTVSLAFDESGVAQIYVGATRVTLEEMKERMRTSLSADPEMAIYVRAEITMPFREIRRVLRACAEVGAFNVIYGTFQAQP
jgi:biopolymer transport protein ExbD